MQIQQDIATKNYDATLIKYWGEDVQPKERLSVVDLFERFIDHKSRQVEVPTLDKYQGLLSHLEKFFKQQSVATVSSVKADSFIKSLAQQLQPITVKERLSMLKSC